LVDAEAIRGKETTPAMTSTTCSARTD